MPGAKVPFGMGEDAGFLPLKAFFFPHGTSNGFHNFIHVNPL
jgi:hypothetical protein